MAPWLPGGTVAGEDSRYTAWLRTQPCCRCGVCPCGEVHHRSGAGLALRSHDDEGMPLCHACHMDLHALTGQFKGWPKEARREWEKAMVALSRSAFRHQPKEIQ
jgi:hypothetical protein